MTRLILSLIILYIAAILQGCTVFIAGAAGGAAALNDPRPASTMFSDETTEIRAVDILYSNSEIATKIHVNITSYNHVVLLSGEVLTHDLRNHVVNIVRNLKNVKRVHNELAVSNLTDLSSRSNDTWITSKVKTNMLATDDFDPTRVKVVTENGAVYLMGIASKEYAHQATEIARNVEGVKRVIRLFEYKEETDALPNPTTTQTAPSSPKILPLMQINNNLI